MTRYLEIYGDVKEKILSGAWSYGMKLPSKRVTAADNGVSVITVEHAYDLLLEEGFIVAKEKSGYFVTYREGEAFEERSSLKISHGRGSSGADRKGSITENKVAGSHVILRPHTAAGSDANNYEGISYNLFAKTARRVLSDYGEGLFERPDGYGRIELREALASYLRNYRGIETDPDRIVVGAGAEYLYGLIIKTVGRDRIYGIENPSYQKIARIYEAEGIVTDPLKLGADGIESRELWNSPAGVLHITPYRSFPTGVTATAAKKAEYLKWSREKNALIIEDDFESEFTPSKKAEDTLFSMDREGRVVYVNTFTRTIGAFVRCAYMVIPERLADLFEEKTGFYSTSVPTLEQLVLAELINNGDFVRHINRVRRRRRELLKKNG